MTTASKIHPQVLFQLKATSGPYAGREFSFDVERMTIGRGPENNLVLAHDPKVSRSHAEMVMSNRELRISNVSEKNFILVNGDLVAMANLQSGDKIQIGDNIFEVLLPEASRTPSSHQNDSERTEAISMQIPPEPLNRDALLHVVKPNTALKSGYIPPAAPKSTPMASYPQQSRSPSMAQNPSPAGMTGIPGVPGVPPSHGYPSYSGQSYQSSSDNEEKQKQLRFYLIAGTVIAVALMVLMQVKQGRKDQNQIRSASQIELEMKANEESIKALTEKLEKYQTGQGGNIYTKSQEYFVRGFRDYQSGQYGLAMESFSVVLTLDPENELAKRYYTLSNTKFKNLIQKHLFQARRSRDNKNYRLCKSSASQVMIMLQGKVDDSSYREAKQFYDECNYASMGRY